MPDTPEQHPTTLKERNRWNLLTAKERKSALRRFWTSLPDVLPFEEWRQSWRKHAGPARLAVSSRRSALSWLWRIRCGMEGDLQQLSNLDFHGLCKQIKTYRSGCSTSKRAKTCRAIRGGKRSRKTRRLKQR
jgi:hypothetical protein